MTTLVHLGSQTTLDLTFHVSTRRPGGLRWEDVQLLLYFSLMDVKIKREV